MNILVYLPTLDTRVFSAFAPVSDLRGELLALMNTHKRLRVEFEVAHRTVPSTSVTFDAHDPTWSARFNTYLQSIPDLCLRYRLNTARAQQRPLVTTNGYEVFVPQGALFRDRHIVGHCTSVHDAYVLALAHGATMRPVYLIPCIMPNGALRWFELGQAIPAILAKMPDAFVIPELNELHVADINDSAAGARWVMTKLTELGSTDEAVVAPTIRCVALYLSIRTGAWKGVKITPRVFEDVVIHRRHDDAISFWLAPVSTRVNARIAKLLETTHAEDHSDLQGSGLPDSGQASDASPD